MDIAERPNANLRGTSLLEEQVWRKFKIAAVAMSLKPPFWAYYIMMLTQSALATIIIKIRLESVSPSND